jgi:hypothetical protein
MRVLALGLLTFVLTAKPVQFVNDSGDQQTEQGRDGEVIEVVLDVGDPTDTVFKIEVRRFHMPFDARNDANQVESVKLYVSVNRGKSWKLAQTCQATDKMFTFTAPRDGQYWFTTQIVYKNGKSDPATLVRLVPLQKVYVDAEHRFTKPR